MSLDLNKITVIRDALLSIEHEEGEYDVYHSYAPSSSTPRYCVWYEDGEDSSLEADGHKGEQAIGGYIDFYTPYELDPYVNRIQAALNALESCYWDLERVQYGDPTDEDDNLYHYVWRWILL